MTKSSSRSLGATIARWTPSLRGLLLILAAFGFGLLAFLLWMNFWICPASWITMIRRFALADSRIRD